MINYVFKIKFKITDVILGNSQHMVAVSVDIISKLLDIYILETELILDTDILETPVTTTESFDLEEKPYGYDKGVYLLNNDIIMISSDFEDSGIYFIDLNKSGEITEKKSNIKKRKLDKSIYINSIYFAEVKILNFKLKDDRANEYIILVENINTKGIFTLDVIID